MTGRFPEHPILLDNQGVHNAPAQQHVCMRSCSCAAVCSAAVVLSVMCVMQLFCSKARVFCSCSA